MTKRIPNTIVFIFLCISLFFLPKLNAQKVGLVLSGGGAGGLAHIGVIKALEKENIPIHYITGTSIGALIGGLYASGYSAEEIEKIVLTPEFQGYTKGDLQIKYQYYFRKSIDNSSWFSYRFALDSNVVANIPTNIINSNPVDFYLMELFSSADRLSKSCFDSLFIPFRCIASDIIEKKSIALKSGNLSESIRASMTYPFYLRPISINGVLLFDGGLYNNFPLDVMQNEFNPDVIIGSVVTTNTAVPSDDNIYLQLRNMLMSKTNYDSVSDNVIILKPWSDIGTFSFDNAAQLIDSGYVCVYKSMEQINNRIQNRLTAAELLSRRAFFNSRKIPLKFNRIYLEGIKAKQKKYVTKQLLKNKEVTNLVSLRKRYYRLLADDNLKSAFPKVVYGDSSDFYGLQLQMKREKPFLLEFGGNFSNRPISSGFLGIQYNHFGKTAFSVYGNAYFGRLNTSGLVKIKFEFPNITPFYLEPVFIFSRWDYFRSSTLFYNFLKPAYLTQRDKLLELNIGMPVGNRSKLIVNSGVASLNNIYYQTDIFSEKDTADRTNFDYIYGKLEFDLNTLNRKLYASEGLLLNFKAKYVNGLEFHYPGTTSPDSIKSDIPHAWFQFQAKAEYYLKTSKIFKLGFMGEGVYSSQDFFRNYTSTILSAPAFTPTPESKTLFLERFRAHNFFAGGMKFVFNPLKNFDIRLEGYVFQPVQSIQPDQELKAVYSKEFLYRYFSGLAALVYHTPLGPLCISANYYYKEKEPFSFLFHFGYTIFNKKSID